MTARNHIFRWPHWKLQIPDEKVHDVSPTIAYINSCHNELRNSTAKYKPSSTLFVRMVVQHKIAKHSPRNPVSTRPPLKYNMQARKKHHNARIQR
jgi:hypothetical protein